MSACNHAIYSARSTIESLFSFKAVVGLGSTFPFNLSTREETQIPVATPPISRSRAKFCLNSSSSDSLPSASSPVSPRLLRRPSKSRLYKGIGLGHPTSKGAPLDEVAMPASKCGGVSDTGVFTMTSGGKVASSIRASGSDLERYTGLGLGAPPTKSRGVTRGDFGASPRRNESNAIPDVPSTFPAELRRISPTSSVTKRHSCKDPAGLTFGHPCIHHPSALHRHRHHHSRPEWACSRPRYPFLLNSVVSHPKVHRNPHDSHSLSLVLALVVFSHRKWRSLPFPSSRRGHSTPFQSRQQVRRIRTIVVLLGGKSGVGMERLWKGGWFPHLGRHYF
ncbi:uncharacterized protein EV420DRAFT_1576939, partial [Desarmillaria tabescens]